MSRNKSIHPLTTMLKNSPDTMIHHDKYIAIYDSKLDQCIVIPGDFQRVPHSQAEKILQSNLKALAGK